MKQRLLVYAAGFAIMALAGWLFGAYGAIIVLVVLAFVWMIF